MGLGIRSYVWVCVLGIGSYVYIRYYVWDLCIRYWVCVLGIGSCLLGIGSCLLGIGSGLGHVYQVLSIQQSSYYVLGNMCNRY